MFSLEDIVVEWVVAGHRHQRAEANPNGVKDLSCCINPYLNKHNINIKHRSNNVLYNQNKNNTQISLPAVTSVFTRATTFNMFIHGVN